MDRLPWLEHERRWRAEREPGAANRYVAPEPAWRLPTEPRMRPTEHPQVGPIATLRRLSLGQCVLCAAGLSPEQLEHGDTYCASCHQKGLDAPPKGE